MSEFSDFCSMLREKSGMTIYHIAKISGMERTALNRMFIGKRVPKYEDVDLLCEVLRASEKEKDHLRELYLMEKMGRKKFENYRYIRKLICDLSQGVTHIRRIPQMAGYIGVSSDSSFVRSRNKVMERVRSVLDQAYGQRAVTETYTNFPVYEDILPVAMDECEKKYGREIRLCHYHILNVNPEEYYDADCNLKVLYYALMWRFSKGINYVPYYTYSQLMLHDLELQFMPYYLVTDSQVLLVSSDFRQGILLDDPDIVLYYRERMVHIREQMHRLFLADDTIREDWTYGKDENELLYSLDGLVAEQAPFGIELYEKGVVVTKEERTGSLSVIITESSLYESFYDFFSYSEEIAEIERGSVL